MDYIYICTHIQYVHMYTYTIISGCVHVLLSMWVNTYFFSAIYNEHWALISFSGICCLLVIAFAVILLPFPLPVPSPTILGHNIPRVLFPRPRPLGGDSPSQSWARGGKTYDQRAAALDYVCLSSPSSLPVTCSPKDPASNAHHTLAGTTLPSHLSSVQTLQHTIFFEVYWT